MDEEFVSIGEAAEILGVSIKTLRRWDENGKIRAFRQSPGGDRLYRKTDLDFFPNDLFQGAFEWASAESSVIPETPSRIYADNGALFQSRLIKLQSALQNVPEASEIFPLVVSVCGEIGGNSFDHNLGKWPDMPGIFFAYHVENREIVLADRGLGVLATLKNARPSLATHEDALRVAFNEVLSGRTSESRGNGLKYVKKVVSENLIGLRFQSGNAELEIKHDSQELNIRPAVQFIQGCIAYVKF